MASILSVTMAAFVHLIFRITLYFDPPVKKMTPGPELPTILVCLAMLDLIYDKQLFPQSYSSVPVAFQYLCETGIAIFLLEVGMLIFWATIKHMIYLISLILFMALGIMTEKNYVDNEDFIVGCFTMPLSIFILALVGQATDHFHILRDHYDSVVTHVALQVDNFMRYLSRPNRQQRNLMRNAYDAAVLGRRSGRNWLPHLQQRRQY